jgi:uncharacterized protein (TIGR03435 family)
MHDMGDNKSGPTILVEPTILRMGKITLADAIRWAYDLKAYQLVGRDGKQWSESTGMPQLYFIEGHFGLSTSRADLKVMLQNLLKVRMGLVCHPDQQQMMVSLAKLSAKGISKSLVPSQQAAPEATDRVVLQLSSPEHLAQMQIKVENATIGEIANELSRMMRAPILDSTGLGDRRYNITGWVMDFREVKTVPDFQDTILDSLGQLGLKVSQGIALVKVLVVDHVNNKLAEN